MITLLLCISSCIFSIVGGVGGGLYMAYFACTTVVAGLLIYFINAFYILTDKPHGWGLKDTQGLVLDSVCDAVQCGRMDSNSTMDNEAGNFDGLLTFASTKAFLTGILYLLGRHLHVYEYFNIHSSVCFLKLETFANSISPINSFNSFVIFRVLYFI